MNLLWQHVQLVIVSLFFGTLFTGVLISLTLRWPAAAQPLIYLCGILFTILSLALFILLPAVYRTVADDLNHGLTLYSLLILLRNVIAGIEKLPATVLESARALGYTRWFRFCRYRAASAAALAVRRVTHRFGDAVGLVTVTALIGQGGLGQLLLAGFNQNFVTPIAVSLVLSVVLSLLLDSLDCPRRLLANAVGPLMDILQATFHWLLQPQHWTGDAGILLSPARASFIMY
ncbi:binding-protein-dependent transport system inner membrane protein [Klebsiella michiganensis]|uniref:Binding-protein-dependent transport system inner membrane protein n=1 Tax=Klebsiella michiganensis TaxID=1134687 RepID=A0A7H4PKJ2_9ENTR|nr:binding-protein-dependent transport system inner membrane protein [Klebsiella michiganensis]